MKYGEEVCAWIRLREGHTATADDIREYCRGQIATYKIPRYVRLVGRVSDDGHGEGSEIQDARDLDRGTGTRIAEDGVKTKWKSGKWKVESKWKVTEEKT